MEFIWQRHLGYFLVLLIILYFVYIIGQDWKEGHPWYAPLGATVLFMFFYEVLWFAFWLIVNF